MPIENLSYTHPIENLSFSYLHPNVPLLRRVLNAADSIKCCDREITLLLQFVQIYCARTSEPLTDSDKKFLAVCAKNVRGTPHSSRPLLLQLKSSAKQALVQPAIALLRQAFSLRYQALQQEQEAISLRDQALQQEQQAISLRDKAAQQEKQAISLRDQALQQEQQAISLRDQAAQQEKQAISLRDQAAQQEQQAPQQEQQAPQPPTMAELMQEQLRAMDEEEENMQPFARSKIIIDPSPQFSQTQQQAPQQEQQAPQPPTMAELMQEQLRAMDEEEKNIQPFALIQIIRDPSQFSQTPQVNKVYGGSSSSNSR